MKILNVNIRNSINTLGAEKATRGIWHVSRDSMKDVKYVCGYYNRPDGVTEKHSFRIARKWWSKDGNRDIVQFDLEPIKSHSIKTAINRAEVKYTRRSAHYAYAMQSPWKSCNGFRIKEIG